VLRIAQTSAIFILRDVDVECLVHLFRIREVPYSTLVTERTILKKVIHGSSQFYYKYANTAAGVTCHKSFIPSFFNYSVI